MEKQHNSGSPGSPDNAEKKAPGEHAAPPLPEISFASFIISLSSSALLHLGEIPDPATNKKERNLDLAKQTIDILGLLKVKTAGNLEKEEAQLLSSLLYDLRMRFLDQLKQNAG